MPSLGISLIAYNEETQIRKALESCGFADQVVVVDCMSTDKTAEIVSQFKNVELFRKENNPNLNVNKSFGFSCLATDWIFYLDPDERIPPTLAKEIKDAIQNDSPVAYKIPRRNHFFGRWLKHGGQFPDRQLRLFKRGKASFPNKHVHESLIVEGEIGYLREPFDHFPYPTPSDYLRKMNFYTSFQADFWKSQGQRISWFSDIRFFFVRPLMRFFRRYFLARGFQDGWPGYIAALGDAFQIALSYAKFRHGFQD